MNKKTKTTLTTPAEHKKTEAVEKEQASTKQVVSLKQTTAEKATIPTPVSIETDVEKQPEPVSSAPEEQKEQAEQIETSDEQAVVDEESTKEIQEKAIANEKLIDRQLEILWANGRKQLLTEPHQTTAIPPVSENSKSSSNQSTSHPHVPSVVQSHTINNEQLQEANKPIKK